MITWTTSDGTKISLDVIGIVAWVVLVVAVLTQNVWLAVLPAAYIVGK